MAGKLARSILGTEASHPNTIELALWRIIGDDDDRSVPRLKLPAQPLSATLRLKRPHLNAKKGRLSVWWPLNNLQADFSCTRPDHPNRLRG